MKNFYCSIIPEYARTQSIALIHSFFIFYLSHSKHSCACVFLPFSIKTYSLTHTHTRCSLSFISFIHFHSSRSRYSNWTFFMRIVMECFRQTLAHCVSRTLTSLRSFVLGSKCYNKNIVSVLDIARARLNFRTNRYGVIVWLCNFFSISKFLFNTNFCLEVIFQERRHFAEISSSIEIYFSSNHLIRRNSKFLLDFKFLRT